MNRRLRVQYPNALYHATSRSVRRGDLYLKDALVLMSHHFHLFFRTPQPYLCRGMQGLLGAPSSNFDSLARQVRQRP